MIRLTLIGSKVKGRGGSERENGNSQEGIALKMGNKLGIMDKSKDDRQGSIEIKVKRKPKVEILMKSYEILLLLLRH